MKKRILSLILIASLLISMNVSAKEGKALSPLYYSQPQKIRCTCYIGGTVTATGKTPHYGIIAGPEAWFGYAVAVYAVNEGGGCGDFIGWFEIDDTGPNSLLERGMAIDLWQESIEDAYEWIDNYGDYVYIKLIDAEG